MCSHEWAKVAWYQKAKSLTRRLLAAIQKPMIIQEGYWRAGGCVAVVSPVLRRTMRTSMLSKPACCAGLHKARTR
jgi:hypothetical protein